MSEWIKKWKWLVIAVCVIVVAAVAISLVVLNRQEDQPEPGPGPEVPSITISLDKTSLQLDLYETAELKATVTGSDAKPVWATSNASVATVENGVVKAAGEGTANITVTVGDASAACQVSVVNSHTAPVIVVSTPNISLGLGEEYRLPVRLMWKGQEVTEALDYTWTPAEDSHSAVASVEKTADGAVIKALSYGKASYTVSTTYHGQLVAQKVDIEVTNLDITFEIANMGNMVGGYKTELSLIDTENYPASIVPKLTVYNKGQKVANPAITWTCADPAIASVDGSGKISAVAAGTVRIVGTYENAEIVIEVTVHRPTIAHTGVYVELGMGPALDISKYDGAGQILDVQCAGVSALKEITDTQLVLDSEKLPKAGEQVKLSVVCEKAEYTIEGTVVTQLIESPADLQAFPGIAAEYPGGYYLLTADLDMKDIPYSNGNTASSQTFIGTFDGQGHTIFNLATKTSTDDWAGGLFGKFFKGTMKNISFVNATVKGQGSFLACKGPGCTLENVYLQFNIEDFVSSYTTNGWINNTSILFNTVEYNFIYATNVIVEYAEPLTGNNGWGYLTGQGVSQRGFKGLYIIGADRVATEAVSGEGGVFGCYADRDAFNDADIDFATWYATGYWTPDENGKPVPTALADYKPAEETKTVTLPGCVYVEATDGGQNFSINLSSVKDQLSGKKPTKATVDGKAFATTNYDGATGILTLDKATISGLTGEKTLVIKCGERIEIRAKIVACTKIFKTAEELKEFPDLMNANPAGYYALGADIDMAGVAYSNASTAPFTGTFDGRNYTISNMASKTGTNEATRGFFGKFFGQEGAQTNATMKNISFVNANVKGQGGFLACKGNGKLENVYFSAVLVDPVFDTAGNWVTNTSVLFGTSLWYQSADKVIVEYLEPLTDNNGWGYAFGNVDNLGYMNGLYIIGADKAYNAKGASSIEPIALGCYADRASFDADVSTWDGNGFWAVEEGFPVPVEPVEDQPIGEPENIQLSESIYVEVNDGGETFTIDLSTIKEQLSGKELTGAGVGSKAFNTMSYEDGILTLDRASLSGLAGEKTLTVVFGDTLLVKVKIVACTKIFKTADELKEFPNLMNAYPAGYYALGANIDMAGVAYTNTYTIPFTGTFDGCGYTISNMASKIGTNEATRGFFGKFFGQEGAQTNATMKNISFVNANVKGQGGFLACKGNGKLENVYFSAVLVEPVFDTAGNWVTNTSVLFGTSLWYQSVEKVIVEYVKPLTNNSGWGYAFGNSDNLGNLNGLYIIGADKLYNGGPGASTTPIAAGCYADRASFDADVSAWDGNGFWTVEEGFPIPVAKDGSSAGVEVIELPDILYVEVADGEDSFVINLSSIKDRLSGKNLTEVTVDGKAFATMNYDAATGVLILDKATFCDLMGEKTLLVSFGSQLQVKVNVVVCSTFVIGEDLPGVVYVEAGNGEGTFTIDLSALKDKMADKELTEVTVNGKAFTTMDYDAATGILTLDKATISGLTGEAKLVISCGELFWVDGKIVVCTRIISTAADLVEFPNMMKENPAGYYALGADIEMKGISYSNSNAIPFVGTFDGQGYTIFNLCTKTRADDWAGGLFGKFFGVENGSALGTLKNISFYNATVKGQGAFLACKGQGTLENVYMLVKIDGLVSSYTVNGWINNTSILFNTVPSDKIYVTNVVLEYAETLADNNNWGYAFGNLNTWKNVNGLHIIGADKAYNALLNPSTSATSGCYADRASFRADVSAWDGNGFWTVVDGFPVPNKLVGYEPPVEPVVLPGSKYMEANDGSETFTIDLSSIKDQIADKALTDASVNGSSFAAMDYDAATGILTLDKATVDSLTGEMTLIISFGERFQVEAKIVVCTKIITTAAQLQNFPAMMANNPAGYYALGADIDMKGIPYSNSSTTPFTGTFDGRGYVVFNLTSKINTNEATSGFFGKFFGQEGVQTNATLKNISFYNAAVKGQGAFLACKGNGKLENVYFRAILVNPVFETSGNWVTNTSVLFGTSLWYQSAENVVVEYVTPLTDNNGYGYPFGNADNLGNLNGFYVIGADKVNNGGGGATVLPATSGCYADRASFNADVSDWDGNGFWTLVDGFPVPNKLVGYRPTEEMTIDGLTYVETRNDADFTIDFGAQKEAIVGLTLQKATVNGVDFATMGYSDGVLTLDSTTLKGLTGEQSILLTFESDSKILSVEVQVFACTMVIKTTDDLVAFPSVAATYPGGYYVLLSDLDMKGVAYSNGNTADSLAFTGTFDGMGHTISNMASKKGYTEATGGFFGKLFAGTLKNVSFDNAIVRGQGAFLACKSVNGAVMENVYLRATFDGMVTNQSPGWLLNTSVLFGTSQNGWVHASKVIVEYAEPLADNNGWGYAVGTEVSESKYNGLYIIGADKVTGGTLVGSNGVYGCYADRAAFADANINFTSWYATGFWTDAGDGLPIPKALAGVKQEVTRSSNAVGYVGEKNEEATFVLNLDDVNDIVGARLVSASVNGTPFTTASAEGTVVTLDKATAGILTGETTVTLVFETAVKRITVNAKIAPATYVISTTEQLQKFPEIMAENLSGTYYLISDLDMTGVAYSNTCVDTFTGIFDGLGHTISNMATKTASDDWDGGFFGKLFNGTLKNISFVNATVRGQGAFLACKSEGKLENLYISVNLVDFVQDKGSWVYNTSILFNQSLWNANIQNVIVEYNQPLENNGGWGYAIGDLALEKRLNGLYIIGADNVYSALGNSNFAEGSAYGAYADRTAFAAAGIDFTSWYATGFWVADANGTPVPVN